MITQDSINIGMTKVNYDIIYSTRRKNATLAVYPMKTVEITVPSSLKKEEIQGLIKKKGRWILGQLLWFNDVTQMDSHKEYVNGETFLYLGRQYRLKTAPSEGRVTARLVGKHLSVSVHPTTSSSQRLKLARAAIWQWYRTEAARRIAEVAEDYGRKIGIPLPKITIKNQSKRWGSCTQKNGLIFNIKLIMAPMSQVEYVVAHELCHVRYKDHSDKYWRLLRLIMPDYKSRKEALRKDGWQYVL